MGWKIYFIALLVLSIGAYFAAFSDYDYIDIPLNIISMIGLFGYAFKRCYFFRGFWKYWLFVIIFWDSLHVFLSIKYSWLNDRETIELAGQYFNVAIIIGAAIGLAIFLPGFIALYLYGYRSRDLWDRDKDLNENSSLPRYRF